MRKMLARFEVVGVGVVGVRCEVILEYGWSDATGGQAGQVWEARERGGRESSRQAERAGWWKDMGVGEETGRE